MAGKIVVPDKDARDPRWVRIHLNRLYDQTYNLLGQLANLEASIRSGQGTVGGLSDSDRKLLRALARGSSETLVPATKPVVPIVAALPATSTATPGELVDLGGTIYEFTAGSVWTPITATAGAHNILSTTHADTVAAGVVRGDVIVGNATPKWARLAKGLALQLLRMNAGATDPEWGAVDDTMLSANVPLKAAINIFSVEQIFGALTALTLGGQAAENGAKYQFKFHNEQLSLAGVTTKDTVSSVLDSFSLLLPPLFFISTTISGGGVTKIRMGDAVTTDRFVSDNLNLTAGNGFVGQNIWQGGVSTDQNGPWQASAAALRITLDAAPLQGVIRVVTCNLVATAPTS